MGKAAVGLIGAIGGAGALWLALNAGAPKDFDECVVREMKGQLESLLPIVVKTCSRRFSRIVEIPTWKVKTTWSIDEKGMAEIYIDDPEGEYKVVSGRFRFSPKDCVAATSNSDFSDEIEAVAAGDNLLGGVPPSAGAKCMKTVSLYGRYR